MAATLQPCYALQQRAVVRTSARRRACVISCNSGPGQQGAAGPQQPADAAAPTTASRRAALAAVVAGIATIRAAPAAAKDTASREGEVRHSNAEWRQLLAPQAYAVLRQARTERPFSSPLVDEKRTGTFKCAGCGQALYASSAKYESGTGWPSFVDVLPGAVDLVPDYSLLFMPRTEVRCSLCQGHIGHVFDDGPPPTGMRYCMNGAAMEFEAAAA